MSPAELALTAVVAGATGRRISAHQTSTVDQHQSALNPKAAQIHRRRTIGGHGKTGPLVGDNLRQAVEQVLDASDSLVLDLFGTDRSDGTDRLEAWRRDARTRYHDLCEGSCGVSLVIGRRGMCLRDRRVRHQMVASVLAERIAMRTACLTRWLLPVVML